MPRVRNATSKSVLLLFAVLIALIFTAVAALSARAATMAGVTTGALAVDERGQASYEIPLSVPPGIAGMAPSLSLIYSSGAGNGIAGLGWSLGGLSAIHRCARNLAQDGAVGGINFDGNDRFCLDGKRLVAIAGAYGADGTEYRTEINGLFKVISYGAAGSGPAWWRVWTKSGQIMDYGATADSRIEAVGRSEAKVWAANKIADSAGNYLTLSYFEDTVTGAHHIERIDYAANDAAGVAAQSAVTFLYEPRPDVIAGYTGGSLGTVDQRLKTVQTSTGGVLVREYRLAYETGAATGRSRLISVTECNVSGDCLSPTRFDWSASSSAGWQEAPELEPPHPLWHTLWAMWSTPPKFAVGTHADINGDGRIDVIYLREAAGDPNPGAYINTEAGWQSAPEYTLPAHLVVDREGADIGIRFLDVNGDGLPDILYHREISSSNVEKGAYLNTGSGWNWAPEFTPPFHIVDGNGADLGARFLELNGDGLVDLLYNRRSEVAGTAEQGAYLNTGQGWQWAPDYTPPRILVEVFYTHYNPPAPAYSLVGVSDRGTRLSDVNGDGLVDLIYSYRHDGVTEEGAYLNTGQGWRWAPEHTPPQLFANRVRIPSTARGHPDGFREDELGKRLVDLNGDGLADIVYHYHNRHTGVYDAGAYINTGIGWVQANQFSPPWDTAGGVNDVGSRFLDANSDGLKDFIYWGPYIAVDGNGNPIYDENGQASFEKGAYLNTGNGWRWAPEYTPGSAIATIAFGFANDLVSFVDLNGDGLEDQFRYALYEYSWSPPSWEESYLHVNGGTRELLLSVTDSLGTQTALTYAPLTDPAVYEKGSGAAFPVQDIQAPMYVVSSVTSDDGVGGQATTRYSYAGAKVDVQGRGFLGFRFMDAIDEQSGIHTTTRHAQDFPFIGQVEFTESYLADGTTLSQTINTLEALSLNGGATQLPFVSRSVAESYELNHGPNNLPVTTATTDSVYDSFGNPTLITVTTAGGGESFVTTTVNSYANDTAKWHLGRLTRAEVTKTLSDLSSATRVSAFAYDPGTGLLSQEVVEPDLPAFRLTTDYVRDVFGNITATTVSGADIEARTSTTTYSADGRFPEVASNALGHSSTSVFDPRHGLAVSQTGPNGITTTWDYDSFGRKLREDRADGTATVWSYEFCTTSVCIYKVRQKQILAATGAEIASEKVSMFDRLNRVTLEKTVGFDGTDVFVDSAFNPRGELRKVTRPYFRGTPTDERQSVKTTSDLIGRPISVTDPNGAVADMTYDGLTTTSSNALGQTQARVNNALGQLVRATDNLGTSVTYRYDPFGSLIETDAGGVVITISHDIRGRKTAMDDADMGAWTYDYSVLGELVSQTNAKLQTVTMAYDKLGRMVSRTEPEGTTTWSYDNPLKLAGIGKLDRVTRTQDDYVQEPIYDSLGRPSEARVSYEDETYSTATSYDEAGRVATLTYPTGFAVEHAYNAFGHLAEVREMGGAGTVYWRAVTVDAEGKVTEEQFGNGLTTLRDFDPADGLVRGIQTFQGLTALQDLAYDFDSLGNLTFRADRLRDREESFTYDGLNRLTGSTVTDTLLLTQLGETTYDYDPLGNITFKSDVGAYDYNGIEAGPHAVTSAGNKSYAYDANGSMTATTITATGGTTRSVAWSSFNKPVHVTAHDTLGASDLVYGPDRRRIKQIVVKGSAITVNTYIGGHFEKRVSAGKADRLKHYIRAGGTVAIYTKVDDGNAATDKTRWLHRDHLGSIAMITREDGTASVKARSHDAFGKLRKANWETATNPVTMWETRRGFTGHEHLDSVGLIHMNGRVYDPEIGRFLSADPTVQYPANLQNYNRYSYVNNNPLSFTDPSGFGFFSKLFKPFKKLFKAIGKVFKAIVGAVKSVLRSKIGQIVGALIANSFGPLGAAAFSALVTVANGGSLTDALMAGAITYTAAWAGGKIGNHFDARPPTAGNLAARSVAHGAVGGVSSKLRGGRFGTGFLSSAFAQLATPALAKVPDNPVAGTLAAAMAGGVAAKLGGGKFADGARTSAFMHALGEFVDYTTRETDRLKRRSCSVGNGKCEVDERGVLRTDGVRNDKNHSGAGSLLWSMKQEASGQHWYDDPKYGLIGRIARYFVTDVSKIHDWMNSSANYDENGLYIDRGLALNTAFDAFYNMPGMPIAAALTFVGYGSQASFAQQAEAYNIYGGRP